ncbi:MAG: proline--tRNA ligase [Candidatus Latescibacterota bacterium]|nr:proline--tRNA ligase [Candidatus Latescibacterota bacterium]
MRLSGLFSQTLREAPADAEATSHILLTRAGYIRQLASGIFSYLPLAYRAMDKIEQIIREEMNDINGQEIRMPVVHSADVWKETGRYFEADEILGRFSDRHGRDMVLAMTHEEIVADLVRKEIRSYRQLPQMLYHFQTKWRDEARPTSGLLRVREFTMKDSYSLDSNQAGLDKQYRAHYQAYFNIFHRCGLPVIAVSSDTGIMGGSLAHEFMFQNDVGENILAICDSCGYAANTEVARFRKAAAEEEEPAELEKVATPQVATIEELSAFLDIPASRTAKAVFVVGRFKGGEDAEVGQSEKLILAMIRGDMEVNEVKLANVVGALSLRPAQEQEIQAVGSVAGYASPIDIADGTLIVADDSVSSSANLVTGANEPGFHVRNSNYDRDYSAEIIADIAEATEGVGCSSCGEPLCLQRGIEVGNIFQLGTRYTDALECSYLDESGKAQSILMGSYGIGVGRLLASVAEHCHDDNGLMWPVAIAPFQVHLVALAKGESPALAAAETIYCELRDSGIEVLFDDRAENAGVKFNDADLLGMPLRITVGDRGLKNGVVEVKLRRDSESEEVALESAVERVREVVADLYQELADAVVEVPYEG